MRFGLLAEPPADQRITGEILQSLMPGWWIIQDDHGRKYRVASSDHYRKGDAVAAVGGQIVGAAGSKTTPAVHQV